MKITFPGDKMKFLYDNPKLNNLSLTYSLESPFGEIRQEFLKIRTSRVRKILKGTIFQTLSIDRGS